MIRLSAIIPTRNRDRYLINAVESLLAQTLENDAYEILVIDNASSDGTMQKVASLIESNINRIRYFYAEEPGLHVCRHLAARKAKGEIVTFTDDDIIAYDGWLEAIVGRFQDSNIALVGGKILPKWEGEVPDWIELFRNKTEYGWTIGHLSLLDFGNSSREIPTKYVWGCNFSIRKPVLFECGGFNPDAMPQELIRYRGDGESGLCRKIQKKGYKAFYEPKALIYHRVPSERLTVEYFCRRAFNQGVSDSYTEIRRNGGIVEATPNSPRKSSTIRAGLKKLKSLTARLRFEKDKVPARWRPIARQIAEARERGKAYHREKVAKNPELLPYILKKHYF
jgi:glycosyltransferase involved in cell wall biosynthesis